MRLSKASAQAALALAYLAVRDNDAPVQARQVAEYLGIPTDSALKILQALSRGQLVQSHLGRTGGYRLRRQADALTLLEIVEAIDGPIVAHLPPGLGEPGGSGVGVLEDTCRQAAHALRAHLERVTVADLARRPAAAAPR